MIRTSTHYRTLPAVALLGALFFAAAAFAETPVRLADINQSQAAGSDGDIGLYGAQSGSAFFFSNSTTESGSELWVTDGTLGGTVMVKDINPGAASSTPIGFVPSFVGGKNVVFFSARTAAEGRELWISDGTAAGTRLVKDIYPGPESSNPQWISGPSTGAVIGFAVVFAATDPTNGRELWASDGTTGGTGIGINLNPGPADSNPSDIYFDGSNIVWAADDGVRGREPWYDTPLISPAIAGDLNAGSEGSNPTQFTLAGNGTKMYFTATTPAYGTEPWVLDLSSPSFTPSLVKDIVAGTGSSTPTNLITRTGNSIYFFTQEQDNPLLFSKIILWKSDGTDPGTTVVKDFGDVIPIPPQGYFDFTAPARNAGFITSPIVASNNKLYFFAGLSNGRRYSDGSVNSELWSSDGTTAGTAPITDLFSGTGGSFSLDLAALGSGVLTPMSDGTHGQELWSSGGTSATTSLVADLNPGVGGFVSSGASPSADFGIGVVVRGSTGALARGFIGNQLKVIFTDGTAANTRVIADAGDSSKTGGSGAEIKIALGNKEIFTAYDPATGTEPYITDGTAAGTALLKDIEPLGSSSPVYFQAFADGSKAVFRAYTAAAGAELWVTDGTAAGTGLVKDINPGAFSSNATPLGAELNGKIFLAASDGASGSELWATDGTAAGTALIKDIALGGLDSNISYAVRAGNQIFFQARTLSTGAELWVSDGTAEGTKLLADINPGSADSNPDAIVALGDQVIFAAESSQGRELWKSDGTAAGTVIIKDIDPGATGSFPHNLAVIGNLVYFAANDGTTGSEIWVTDGTAAGTRLVKDINDSSDSSDPSNFTVLGSQVIFTARDAVHGTELWATSGSADSTVLLKDIDAGSNSGSPDSFTSVPGSNLLFFEASTAAEGYELWQTDGTSAGTVLVRDIKVGAGSSIPETLRAVSDKLIFSADDGVTGFEPWALTVDICLNDPAKTAPGVCGCGVSDADANGNGVTDCLAPADLKAQLAALTRALAKLKPAKNARQLKALKANKKAALALLKGFSNIVKAHKADIQLKKGKGTLTKKAAKIKADVTAALKLQGSLLADVKKAKADLAALSKIILG